MHACAGIVENVAEQSPAGFGRAAIIFYLCPENFFFACIFKRDLGLVQTSKNLVL